jgi:hypothetical protein
VDPKRLQEHIQRLHERQDQPATEAEHEATALVLAAYLSLQSRLSPGRRFTVREGDRRRASAEAMGLQIALTNCREATISIAQMFRIQDFLTQPDELLATNLREVVNDVGKLRRTFNRGGGITIDGLGLLEPVAHIGETRDRESFWYPAIPDLRDQAFRSDPPLTMIPFQLLPFPSVDSLRYSPELWIEDLVKDILGPSTQQVDVASVRGALRLYPTGVGVVRLTTELRFGGPILVELIAKVAREVESTVFVDTQGQSRNVESFLSELVNQVAAKLFKDAGDFDRRWRPPETIIRFRQGAFLPEDHTRELAYAMSLSPGNRESLVAVRSRIENKLRSSQWANEGVLAVPGRRVLMLVRSIDPKHKGDGPTHLLKFIGETHELTSVALHTFRVFAEDLERLRDNGWPNDEWLPKTDNFARLQLLVDSLRRAVRAVVDVPRHLGRTGRAILSAIAHEVWNAEAAEVVARLEDVLVYVANWIRDSGYAAEPEMTRLASALSTISKGLRPFAIRGVSELSTNTATEELLENDILDGLQRIEELLASDAPDLDFSEIDSEILRVEQARRRLFAPLD